MTSQYLISARADCRETRAMWIERVLSFVRARPDAEVVNLSGQPPTSLAIKATPAAIEAIRQAFGPDVVIEADEPLSF
jgi:hypothetical protein